MALNYNYLNPALIKLCHETATKNIKPYLLIADAYLTRTFDDNPVNCLVYMHDLKKDLLEV